MRVKFIIPGKPVGYKTTTHRSKWNKDYNKYVKYKKDVQSIARMAGLNLPLKATRRRQLIISTIAYFKDGRHPDPENVNKGVRDALFYDEDKKRRKKSGKGDDKQTGGSFAPPRYDKENPRVLVLVKSYKPKADK